MIDNRLYARANHNTHTASGPNTLFVAHPPKIPQYRFIYITYLIFLVY